MFIQHIVVQVVCCNIGSKFPIQKTKGIIPKVIKFPGSLMSTAKINMTVIHKMVKG